MLYFTESKLDCTGCGACMAVCPVNCISFVFDEEGFAYPEADSRCISCGRCERVCPIVNNPGIVSYDFEQFCVAGRHIDDEIWYKSASGGAFSAICEAYCDIGDAIFGAKFDSYRVVHDWVLCPNSIDGFRKSKYVQSNMANSFHRIRRFLGENRRVIFSGTPCQVAGVRNFLGKDFDNFLCIDLVCHGVGSPGVFQKYMEHLERKHNSKVKSFTFRSKKAKMGRLLQYVIVVQFENGEVLENEKDPYNTAFIQTLIIRPSCSHCKFASLDRVGDLTLADFKKKHELLPQARKLDNFSTVIVNSGKGQAVFERLQEFMSIYPVSLSDVVRTNPPLRIPSRLNDNREAFFDELRKTDNIETALQRYISTPKLHKRIWMSLPDKMRGIIKRTIAIGRG